MRFLLLSLAVLSGLVALPVAAQQGPAGVPGAPWIGATIAPPPPPSAEKPKEPQRKRTTIPCSKAKDVEQCRARAAAKKQAREACKDKKGKEYQQCLREQLPPVK